MSQKPANDQHALAGLGETLVGLETEKIKKITARRHKRGVFTTGCDAPLGGISDK